ncbi:MULTISPECIES: O-antigen ligase [unclassified Endozoicomonas]|uniref:O-antigen ligase family protein n=1 Tax=unclassified Endozoicomonas TaxID=2644528 RepID=UPI0021491F48|nr:MULTISPECIES: O-antigen ligase family protein [unclassified Endozoicomonas]
MFTVIHQSLQKNAVFLLITLTLLAMWSALLIWNFGLSSYNFRRVVQVIFLSVIFGVFLSYQTLNGFAQLPFLAKVLIFPGLVFGSCSALMSEYPVKGIQEVGLYGLLMMSSLLLAKSIDERRLAGVISVIGLAIGLYGFGYLFHYAVYLQYPPDAWRHTVYGFTNPRILNHAQNWLIPLLALLPLLSKDMGSLVQRLSWVPLVVMYFFVFLSESRGIVLSLIMSGIAIYLCFRKAITAIIRVHIKALIVGLLAYWILIWLIPFFLGNGLDGFRPLSSALKTYDRVELWISAWQLTLQNPMLGVGPQQFILSSGNGLGSPHNVVLQWLSEWGTLATLCFVILLLWGSVSYLVGLKKRLDGGQISGRKAYIQISALWAISSAALHAQISGVLITPMSQMMMVLVVGYCLHAHVNDRLMASAQVKGCELIISKLLVLTLIVLSMIFFIIFYVEFIQGTYPVSIPFESMTPRFWQNGAFHLIN